MLSKASGRDRLWKRVSGTEADPAGRGTPRPHLAAPYELEEEGSVASHPELSLLSPWEKGWGKRLRVCMRVHTGGIRCMGRGRVLPPP